MASATSDRGIFLFERAKIHCPDGRPPLLREVEDADVAEADTRTVTAETDVPALVEHSRMIPVVNGVRIGLTSIRSHIMPLASLAEIPIENDLAVERHGNMVAHDLDLLLVPSPERLVYNTLRRNDTVG